MRREISILDVAVEYRRKEGWYSVPVEFKAKAPRLKEWQWLRLDTPEQLAEYFNGPPQNIGVLLGSCSGDIVDSDLDQPECLAFAKWLLPSTRIFGRPGNINSHWLFHSPTDATRVQFFALIPDENGKPKQHMFVELRANQHQTVFPPSTHESGESILWTNKLPLTSIEFAELEKKAGWIAAGAALAQAWPRSKGCRHSCEMALAGMLLRSGWTNAAEKFICTIATIAKTENAAGRAKNVVTTTRERLDKHKPVTGWRTLSHLLNQPELISKVPDWLGYALISSESDRGASQPDKASPAKKIPTRMPRLSISRRHSCQLKTRPLNTSFRN